MLSPHNAESPSFEQERAWVDGRMRWLIEVLGEVRLRTAEVVLPTEKYFPDEYDQSDTAVRTLVARVRAFMGLGRVVDLRYYSAADPIPPQPVSGDDTVWIDPANLNDPLALVAEIARQLGYSILLDQP